MECPYNTSNPHIYNCLVHRKNNNFPAAVEELKLACAENDQDALWFALYMRSYGGLGIFGWEFDDMMRAGDWRPEVEHKAAILHFFTDPIHTRETLVKAVDEKNLFAPFLFLLRRDYYYILDPHFKSYVDLCCKWNDPYMLFLVSGIDNLCKAMDQKMYLAFQPVIDTYYYDKEYLKAAKVIVSQIGSIHRVYRNIKIALATKTEFDRENQCFVFGRWLSKRTETDRLQPMFANSIRIYTETIEKAKKACLYFLLVCKEMRVYRDIAKLIAKMLWDEREDVAGWNVNLGRRGPQRRVKKIKL